MGNEIFLIGAYMVAWIGITLYVHMNVRKLGVIEQKISDIQDKLGN